MLELVSVGEDVLCHVEQSSSILLSRATQVTAVEPLEVGSIVSKVAHTVTLYAIWLLDPSKSEFLKGVLVDEARDVLHQLSESSL